jgi:TIGR03009 family protein
MTRFARGGFAAGGIAVWLAASTAIYAQSGAPNNPLRGNQPPAANPQQYGGQPRVANQPAAPTNVQPQPAGGNQPGAVGQPNQGGQPNGGGQRSGGVLPNGQPAQPPQLQTQPPFTLTPQEQLELDKLLKDWEAKSDKVKSFKCTFRRWEYNPAFANGNPNQATTESEGEIKYYAPDKGLFRVTKSWDNVLDPATGKFQPTAEKPGEYWTCTGDSVFEVNHLNKTVEEHPLPPHLKGKAITEGPLPFVFGAKADVLKQRYFMRINMPPGAPQDQIWLEAIPKTRQGAANFSKVELILNREELMPVGMQIHDPGANANNLSRTAIMLENHSVNNPWAPLQQLLNNFARPNPIGFKQVVIQPQAPAAAQQGQPPAQVQNPGGAQPSARQAVVPQGRSR